MIRLTRLVHGTIDAVVVAIAVCIIVELLIRGH